MHPPLTPPQFREWRMSDDYVIHGRWWGGAPASQVAVIYLHGIQSHGGWYQRSASLIASLGFPVLLPDRRGSGLNQPQRGDAPSMQRWLDDVDELAAWVATKTGVRRIALAGVSWGGKAACGWALQRPERCIGLALIAPGIFPRVDIGVSERLRVGWALISNPEASFEIPLQDPRLFTANSAAQAWIAQDRLKLTHVTGRFLYESRRLDRLLIRAGKGVLPMPVWLALAQEDRIIRNDATRRWLARVAPRPLVTEFTNAYHTLEFEPDREPFESALRDWMCAVAGPPPIDHRPNSATVA